MSNDTYENWHSRNELDIVKVLVSNTESGLERAEVEKRREKYGKNTLTVKKTISPLVRFLVQFHQALVYILLVAIGVKLYLGAYVDASVIFGVVLLNAIIGFAQESKALNALAALSQALLTTSTVLRSGEKQQINAKELVVGDIVLLQSGDKVPADIRLLSSRELQIDESALTGESTSVAKMEIPLKKETSLADRSNMLYSSTLVTYGMGTGIVVEIGDNTEIGHISKLLNNTQVLTTPLTRKISKFSHILLLVILGLATLTFLIGLWHGNSWESLFMASVALSVAMIPEGLPAVMTIILAIGVSRMSKQNTIIRHLPAVETLGSTTIICSDKTGTLTRNEMTVQELFTANENFEISGIGYIPDGEIRQLNNKCEVSKKPTLLELLKAGLLCNDSMLKGSEKSWTIEGDPTEGALLVSAKKAYIDFDLLYTQMPRVDTIPFESQYQYMATLHFDKKMNQHIVYLKGSVESVLERCSTYLDINGNPVPIINEEIHIQVQSMAKKGLRVLAFAKLITQSNIQSLSHDNVAHGLEFIGLQGMIDPPREEAIRSIEACKTAGIQVKMITGDHVITATAIATKMGLIQSVMKNEETVAITGKELEVLNKDELIQASKSASVFARVTPEQKLRIVEALQADGEIVAMTGDGVNDAPAVRKANIGIAMGITGTEVAKEAADMVLTDDNFASIEAAVEEGRGVLDNIIKFLGFILATNFGEGLVIIVAILVNETLPILPVQALWINMTASIFLGLTLAFEPREPGLMQKQPRLPSLPLLNGEMIFRIFLVGLMLLGGSFGLFELALNRGASLEEARTIAVNVFAVGESFYLLNSRSLRFSIFKLGIFTNMWIWGGVLAMITASIALTYLPIMNQMFHTAPIGLNDWLHIFGVGLIIYSVVSIEKIIRQRLKH
ncbi:cation-transporting P-type ATPase [Sulfurimonas gotlandica GD1]|uniref:Cation-transporting P-type ATPase n=1 Tax=Sulfurimonas gotlandica (strain DSM 19862 / JCM 16533 / GD1) TaxID=929558 RepID=B6BL40_SULGG|nr:cation-transporting P-type ATPase [Sulfurimonas gotlandica]EDZ62004.1 cation-transporting ATPase Pma1 [Sulfurimonas gotlandica GD1]EHP28775.1 cation-transporting P-type ATPase [Sulfurimonas gotlandica GD1]